MKLLFLSGIGCIEEIWNPVKSYIKDYDCTFITYPRTVTKQANSINDLADWLFNIVKDQSYDVIIGHSAGGLIALQLLNDYSYTTSKLVLVESNLKPAKAFYRNLVLNDTTSEYKYIIKMLRSEMPYYTEAFQSSIQNDFDYTYLLDKLHIPVYVLYGDRGNPNYKNRFSDLCLDDNILNQLNIRFVANSCHMPMIESPEEFSKILIESIK
ncbi:alpha/beta fold hydrolase [Breznakia pachnodae]|uniref:Pimeloyl-ACP methyl ester carboxylesterase n=1 Tax=Breznakia pachnodae TaxID=265178 RepID=A0ABU0E7Y0_9FIRM|nr:alpha/beta hydrolase [Breznakia pachnodae]MDQ0362813.1 pimeloyl-ACP methyl ester carboxylesterase [Breznakia pachnodae]